MKLSKIFILLIVSILFVSYVPQSHAIDNEKINQTGYNNYSDERYKCGIGIKNKKPLLTDIPKSIPRVIHIIYLVIEIAVPIVLVVFGSIDLFKGMIAQKEDEIKKGQQTFIKRLIYAAIIFMILVIAKIMVGMVADSNKNRIIDCVECFIDEKCEEV